MSESLFSNVSNCSGCGACRNICPTGAIKLLPDSCGFVYPRIEQAQCTNCGLCRKVCPYKPDAFSLVRARASTFPSDMHAVQVKDAVLLNHVSSGGAAALFVAASIKYGGVAYGAAFDAKLQVSHQRATDNQEALRFCKSKYVQSDTGLTFRQVKEDLVSGRKVVYVGCPCQIAGLYGYLGRTDPKLLTVDFLCHGVPSQQFFNEYLEIQRKGLGEIVSVDFRERLGVYQKPLIRISGVKSSESRRHSCDPYMFFFHKSYSIRPSCAGCAFRTFPRQTDITVADFWEMKQADFPGDISNGVSRVFLNTEKGRRFFDANKDLFHHKAFPFDESNVRRFSARLVLPIDRRKFLRHLCHASFAELVNVYPTTVERLHRAIRRFLVRASGWTKSKIRKGIRG